MKFANALPRSCALLVALACSSQGSRAVDASAQVAVTLSAGAQEELADEPEVRAELSAVLLDYFGEPLTPRFGRLEAWAGLGFDPNGSPLRGARPASDMSGTEPGAIVADNQRYWAKELAALESGDPSSIGPWPRRGFMNAAWQRLLAQRALLGPAEFQRQATEFFTQRYPDLSEAAQLFMPHCMRCHGREGAGDGPMAARLSPRPRDYRRGVFKFAAVDAGSKPRRADLLRTLVHGLPGSAMPSFRATSLAELNALIDYVRYLAVRGEFESRLLADWEISGVRPRQAAAQQYEFVWSRWLAAHEHAPAVVVPPADRDPRRLALGESVFHDRQRGNCVGCHGEMGRGDGIAALRSEADGQTFALLRDEWGNYILPRDLTSGVFRGGSSREDIYLRIHCGIPGTPMPAFGASTGSAPMLSEQEKWAVVDYVLSLSGRGPFGSDSAR